MPTYTYRIDKNDRLTYVSSEWLAFAKENSDNLFDPDEVLGHSLWEFVVDKETVHLYKMIIKKVHETKRLITVPLRCDSPTCRRELKIDIYECEDHGIQFDSHLITVEPRASVNLLDKGISRSNSFVTLCGWCNKVKLEDPLKWVEVEVAISELKLFNSPELPHLSHGICPSCLSETKKSIP